MSDEITVTTKIEGFVGEPDTMVAVVEVDEPHIEKALAVACTVIAQWSDDWVPVGLPDQMWDGWRFHFQREPR